MAGTVSVIKEVLGGGGDKGVQKITVTWTSDASGNADTTLNLFGYFLKGVTDPTDGPTDNYDITLVQDGADQLTGLLTNRDTTNSEVVYGIAKNSSDIAPVPPFLVGDHTFTVAAAGNAKSGVCILYVTDTL
jgi:uncharacterized phage infection (PIP) family protein YhgE